MHEGYSFEILMLMFEHYLKAMYCHLPTWESIRGKCKGVFTEEEYGNPFMALSDREFVDAVDALDNPAHRPPVGRYGSLLWMLHSFLPVLKDCKMSVDVCCGDMPVLRFLRDEGFLSGELLGVEPSLPKAKQAKHADVHHGWPDSIPLADASANLAVCYDAFNLIQDWPEVADETARVLVPGGIVAAGFDAQQTRSGLDGRTLAKYLETQNVEPLKVLRPSPFDPYRHLYVGVKIA